MVIVSTTGPGQLIWLRCDRCGKEYASAPNHKAMAMQLDQALTHAIGCGDPG